MVNETGTFTVWSDEDRTHERYTVRWKVGWIDIEFEAIEEHQSNPQRLVAYHGRLKFDGCMDWETGGASPHSCRSGDVERELYALGNVLGGIYAIGPKMENWMGN